MVKKTGDTDDFEDDFTFGDDKGSSGDNGGDKGSAGSDKDKDTDDNSGDDNSGDNDDDNDKGTGDDDNSGDDKDTDNDDDDKGDASNDEGAGDVDKDKKAGTDDKKGKSAGDGKTTGDIDIFSDDDDSGDKGKFNFKNIATRTGIDLEKEDDLDEFVTKVNKKVSESRQEFNLDAYTDDAKTLIKHLNDNGGDIKSFFNNKTIISMHGVLAMDPESKVRSVRYQELIKEGKTPEEANTAVDTEIDAMSKREIRDEADGIDTQAQNVIDGEMKKIIRTQSQSAEERRQKEIDQKAADVNKMKNFVKSQNNFMGFNLTDKAKSSILVDIDNGGFEQVINSSPEQARFVSYMFAKYGNRIMKQLTAQMNDKSRQGYNDATKKHLDSLHNSGDKGNKNTGHNNRKSQSGSDKPGWSDDVF